MVGERAYPHVTAGRIQYVGSVEPRVILRELHSRRTGFNLGVLQRTCLRRVDSE